MTGRQNETKMKLPNQKSKMYIGNDGKSAWLEISCGLRDGVPYCNTSERVALDVAKYQASGDESGLLIHVESMVRAFAERTGVESFSDEIKSMIPTL